MKKNNIMYFGSKKVAYGLIYASRNWYYIVSQEMDKVQYVKSKYDGVVFFCKQNGILQGMMASHVDDFLDCGSDNEKRCEPYYRKV